MRGGKVGRGPGKETHRIWNVENGKKTGDEPTES
jgi:hypothetical protein